MTRLQNLKTAQGERIAVVSGLRTPFARQSTAFAQVPAVDLGKLVVNEMLQRLDFDPKLIDQLVFGQVVQMPEAPNIAREIVLGTGMNVHTSKLGLQAVRIHLLFYLSVFLKKWPQHCWH